MFRILFHYVLKRMFCIMNDVIERRFHKQEEEMRKYEENQTGKLIEAYCNCCGKKLLVKDGMIMEGVLPLKAFWGYFSEKDGEKHSFDLCESCYDKWVAGFQIPVEKKMENEML